jgi:cell division protein ZapA (FtsZ GTPase activity inhibitor)
MSIVTITINNKKFQIGCNDGQEELVTNAASKLDEKIQTIKKVSPTASTELLLIMCALGLQDDNSTLRKQLGKGEIDNPDAEVLSQALTSISRHLENIANKIT